MEAIFFLLSVACIVYFFVIVAYSGITTVFCGMWVFFAAVFALMGYFCIRRTKNEGSLPKRLPVFVFVSFGIAAVLCSWLMLMIVREAKKPAASNLDYVVVLGTKVNPDGISKALKKRLDRTYEYHLENPDTVFILSGGQGADEVVPEALAMYNYLHLIGMPTDRMRIEMDSTSTTENLVFSGRLIEAEEAVRKKRAGIKSRDQEEGLQIGVLSSDFHLMRAVRIAKKQGYESVYGIAAPSDSILFLHMCMRECIVTIKDFLMGNL